MIRTSTEFEEEIIIIIKRRTEGTKEMRTAARCWSASVQ
jgi:hypothetical protein